MSFNLSILFAAIVLLPMIPGAIWERNPTFVHMTGTVFLENPNSRNVCVRVLLYEVDTFSDDLVADFGVVCTTRDRIDYEINGKVFGDGFRDLYYEFQLRVRHNATLDGKVRQQIHDLGSVPVSQKLYVRVKDLQAISDGNTTISEFGAP